MDYQFQFDWDIFPLPLENIDKIIYKKDKVLSGPAFYRGYFEVEEALDTYLDTCGLEKGVVYINGFNIGRYWNIGPQKTMYIPAPLLKKGRNEIVVFELHKINHVKIFLDINNHLRVMWIVICK